MAFNSNNLTISRPNYQFWTIVVVLGIASLCALLSFFAEASVAVFWLIGLAFGVTVQRSRFCFTSAFRDFFLLGQVRVLKGILAGLAVSTIGFAVIMSMSSPNPAFGSPPSDANILPVGLSTLIAGTLFGIGMVLAGGCVSGSLYRMGEGYIASWVAILGVITGLFFLNQTWNWWWDNLISRETPVWLPAEFTYTGALIITTIGLLSILYVSVWKERKVSAGFTMPQIKKLTTDSQPTNSISEIFSYLKKAFSKEWSPITGGIILGLLNIILFIRFRPLGVVGEISRWSTSLSNSLGIPTPYLDGMDLLGACAPILTEGASWFTEGFFLNTGIVAGAFCSAVFAREFKLRIPKSPIRYVQSMVGGIVMGYGAGLGLGCTLGAFFSAIPSLALNGWVYAVGLTIGAYISVQWVKKFS